MQTHFIHVVLADSMEWGINFTQMEIAEAVHFQEQYYESEIETIPPKNTLDSLFKNIFGGEKQ